MKQTIIILTVYLIIQNINAQSIDSTMLLIPGGYYMMGKDTEWQSDYNPLHRVFVDSFYMDIHEVTNREYLKFCNATDHRLPVFWNVDIFHCGENYLNYPVVGIGWLDAKEYAEWAGKRLPTEAEWEYAARGGLEDNDFPNGSEWEIPLRRNERTGYWENLTVEVKSFEPNGYGLYNMGGNVWEWVNDIYQDNYYENSEMNNPKGPQDGSIMVIRGGSWHSGITCHKVYFRKGLTSNWNDFAVGFRCVKDID